MHRFNSSAHSPARTILLALMGVAVLATLMAMALVAPAAAADTTVNLSSAIDQALALVSAVVVSVLGGIAALIMKKLKLDRILADAAMNKMLHDGIQRGVDAVEGLLRNIIFRDGRPVMVDLHSEAVATVANRMIELSPDLLRRLGVSEETLKRLVTEAIAARASLASGSGLARTVTP